MQKAEPFIKNKTNKKVRERAIEKWQFLGAEFMTVGSFYIHQINLNNVTGAHCTKRARLLQEVILKD